MPLLLGAGLVALAGAWNPARDDAPVRLALLLVGGGGVLVAFPASGRLLGAWYLALGGLWVLLGLAAWLDARRPGS